MAYDLGGEWGLHASKGRQSILVAKMPFTFEDLTSGEAGRAVVMPVNSRVIGGELVIYTAFNSGTSDTGTVGDGDTADRYASGVDMAATGRTALTPTAHKYTGKDSVDLTWTGVDAAPTQGEGELIVHYVMDDRAIENQPVGGF